MVSITLKLKNPKKNNKTQKNQKKPSPVGFFFKNRVFAHPDSMMKTKCTEVSAHIC